MYRTCTVQTNLDYSSEADMVKKLRVSLALQPVATAMFANSPFTEGKPNGFLSFRSEIWRDTDPDRSGMLPWAFEPGMGFDRYVDYALSVPMYFVKRGDHYIDVAGQSFRDLMAGDFQACPASAPRSRTGRTTSRRFFRRCGSSAISKCAARTAVPGGGCQRCRPIGPGSSTTMARSMPPGTWSKAGQPRSARNCATMCRSLVSPRRSQALTSCNWRRPRSRSRKRDLRDAAAGRQRLRRKPISATDRGIRRARYYAGRGAVGQIPRPLGGQRRDRCSRNMHTEVSPRRRPDPLLRRSPRDAERRSKPVQRPATGVTPRPAVD